MESDRKIKRSQAAQHLPQGNPATQSVAPTAQTVTQAAQVVPPAAQSVTPAIQPELVKPNPKTGKIAGTCLVILMLVGFGIFAVFLLGKSLLSKIDLSSLEFLGLPFPDNSAPVVSAGNSECILGPYVDEPDNYGRMLGVQPWKSTVPDSFYLIDLDRQPMVEISGKPWMWITCDAVSGDIEVVQFGMTEVTWTILDNGEHTQGFDYPPDGDASSLPKELGLTGPIWIIGSSDKGNGLTEGDRQFSWMTLGDCERWEFTYTSDNLMTGDVTNLNPNNCLMQSSTDAFHLARQ